MSKFIELKQINYAANGDKVLCPLLLNLSKVTAVFREDNECHIYTDNAGFHVSADSYDKLCAALKAYKEDNVADKLCELQHDHTWSMQALANVLLMCKGDKTSYHPAIMLGCYDKDLERMNEAVYGAVLGMQERIKELEDEIKIMQETKKTSNA
jgi:hypothetical protein